MSRAPSAFRQTDVVKAIKAVRIAGCRVARVTIGKDGRIEVITATEGEAAATPVEQNEWDDAVPSAEIRVR